MKAGAAPSGAGISASPQAKMLAGPDAIPAAFRFGQPNAPAQRTALHDGRNQQIAAQHEFVVLLIAPGLAWESHRTAGAAPAHDAHARATAAYKAAAQAARASSSASRTAPRISGYIHGSLALPSSFQEWMEKRGQ